MKVLLIGFCCLFAVSANATILTFDDVPGGSTQNNVGDMPTYNGFDFSFTLDWIDVEASPSWNFGAHPLNQLWKQLGQFPI